MDILLNKNKSKKSSNVNNSLLVSLTDQKRILPIDTIFTNINEIDLYNNERKLSNLIHLTCTVNTFCSNMLFNPITEIVYKEGSSDCICLNFCDENVNTISNNIGNVYSNENKNLVGKTNNYFSSITNCIRDTQISNLFDYKCGVDIFNNHILRNKSFKSVCKITNNNDDFNTIFDYTRDVNGNIKKAYNDIDLSNNSSFNAHLDMMIFTHLKSVYQIV